MEFESRYSTPLVTSDFQRATPKLQCMADGCYMRWADLQKDCKEVLCCPEDYIEIPFRTKIFGKLNGNERIQCPESVYSACLGSAEMRKEAELPEVFSECMKQECEAKGYSRLFDTYDHCMMNAGVMCSPKSCQESSILPFFNSGVVFLSSVTCVAFLIYVIILLVRTIRL